MNIDNTRRYYGEVLAGSSELRTDACCTTTAPPAAVRAALAQVHADVRARYYGCGLVVPDVLEGLRVLDLGSGSGQDAYVLAQLVGARGSVVGVDATPAQLDVARRHLDWHAERFGFGNVAFLDGDIERLDALDLASESFDLVVSNCVINLVADKEAVFRAAHRLLKPGGELFFADVYADRRVPAALRHDPVLHGECLAGALYWGDFLQIAGAAGLGAPRLGADRPRASNDAAIALALAGTAFFSATFRLFKLAGLEPRCEDYGQAVRYRGTIAGAANAFTLDKHHRIETGRLFPVCGNTQRMLAETRLAPHFEFFGDTTRHFGVFAGCGIAMPFDDTDRATAAGGCC